MGQGIFHGEIPITIMVKFLFIVAVAEFNAVFGRGTGPIFLSNMNCTGTESSLLSCSRRRNTLYYCSHNADAGVVCPICK